MSNDSDYKPGSMDVSQHIRGYHAFLSFTKFGVAGILLIMIFLALFRTHN